MRESILGNKFTGRNIETDPECQFCAETLVGRNTRDIYDTIHDKINIAFRRRGN